MDQEKRDYLGREVRNVWIAFAREQADPKPSHLVGWNEQTAPASPWPSGMGYFTEVSK